MGDTLTADTSSISDDDGLTKVSYQYQWIRNDGTSDAEIASAADSTYALADDDEGNTVKVRVSFTDDDGNDESLTSPETATVAARPNSPATGTLAITGTAQVGRTLTADTSGIADDDGLTNVSYSYQAEGGYNHDLAKRGGALQGVALSSMRFTPLAGNSRTMKTDKKGALRLQTHLLLDRPEIEWPCRT